MRFLVSGHVALLAKLREVKAVKARKALRKGSRAGAKVIQAASKAAWPTKTGTTVREMKVRSLKRSRTRVGTTMRIWVRSGKATWASFRELGTKHMPPGHFLRRAAETAGPEVMRVFLEGITTELEG